MSTHAEWMRRKGRTSKWISPKRRMAIYLRDYFTCQFCGMDLIGESPRDVHLDHIVPRDEGGSHQASNLLTTCGSCNSARHNTDFDWWCATKGYDADTLYWQARQPLDPVLAATVLSGACSRAVAADR